MPRPRKPRVVHLTHSTHDLVLTLADVARNIRETRERRHEAAWDSIFRGELIYVILFDNSHVSFMFSDCMTVLELKSMVSRETGIPLELQFMYLATSESQLVDALPLREYGIAAGDSVFLVGLSFMRDAEGFLSFAAEPR